MLGSSLVNYLSKFHDVFATSRSKGIEGKNIEWSCFDLTDIVLLDNWLNEVNPDVVIHCAAIVNVDACEDEVELATNLHVKTTKVIANYLDSNNGRLIYISTDSVFDGEKQSAYRESDLVSPLNVYAKTKLMGESLVLSMKKGLVLRVNIVGCTGKNRVSFAEWMFNCLNDNIPMNLFYDVYFSPLNVYSLSVIIKKLINRPIYGLYHCASRDSISKYDFGMKMAEIFQLDSSNINKTSVNSVDFMAPRPKQMALNIDKISNDLKHVFPSAVDAIKLLKHQLI